MVFESAVVMTPIIIALSTITFKRIDKLELRFEQLPTLFVTKSELAIHMTNIESKLERIEMKLDYSNRIATLESDKRLQDFSARQHEEYGEREERRRHPHRHELDD